MRFKVVALKKLHIFEKDNNNKCKILKHFLISFTIVNTNVINCLLISLRKFRIILKIMKNRRIELFRKAVI